MSSQVEEIKIASAMKKAMLKKLRTECGKSHWRETSVNDLIAKMDIQVENLKSKLMEMCLEEAKDKCVDVANSASQIFDNIEQKFINDKAITGKPSLNIENLIGTFFTDVYDKLEKGGKQSLCEKLEVTFASISAWRKGERVPRMDTLDEMWLMVTEARNEA